MSTVYILNYSVSDDATYSFDVLERVFLKQEIAEYVAEMLNEEYKKVTGSLYDIWTVDAQEVIDIDSTDVLDIMRDDILKAYS